MVVTMDMHLPTDEELTVPEVNLSGPVLMAASLHLGKYCEHQNNEFMLCRIEEKDPRKCLNEGKDVTACTMEFFKKVKKSCYDEFSRYYNCIDKSSGTSAFEPCRKTQAVFDKCALDNLNVERPPYGYFTEVRVHETSRPKPPEPPVARYPDATPGLSPDTPCPPAKYGARWLD